MRIRYPQDYARGAIGPLPAFSILFLNLLGVGVLYLPASLVNETGRSGIFAILTLGFIAWVLTCIASWWMKQFPHKTFWEIGNELFGIRKGRQLGKWLFTPIIFAIVFNWIEHIVMEIALFVYTLKVQYFTRTPTYVLIFLSVLLAFYAAKQGPVAIARLNLILLPFAAIPLLIILIFSINKGDLINIIPTLPDDWGVFINGILHNLFSFSGFFIFIGYMGFYRKPENAIKHHSWAIWTITIWYTVMYLCCLSVFGPDDLKNYTTPVLQMATESIARQFFLERLDSVFLPTWMILVFTTAANTMFAATYFLKELFQIKEEQRGTILVLVSAICVGFNLFPTNIIQLQKISYQADLISWCVIAFIIILLSILTILRKRKERRSTSA